MTKEELLERYEARGEESDFLAAKRLYERELADAPSARVLNDYGYLLECHGRRELRLAVELYEQAIELDPDDDKPHFQLISARAGLQETDLPVAAYERRAAGSPGEVREHRFLANAYLRAHDYERVRRVVDAALELAPYDAALLALRGESKAGLADPEGALADWRRALELDPEDIGPPEQHRLPARARGPTCCGSRRVALDRRVERVAGLHAAERVAAAGARAATGSVRRYAATVAWRRTICHRARRRTQTSVTRSSWVRSRSFKRARWR